VIETTDVVVDRCYALVADDSEVRVLVYRDGPLARLGHNHVLVAKGLQAVLAVTRPPAASILALRLDVNSFTVDPVAARAEEGADFASTVSEQARTGTRQNLLGEQVLDARRFPVIEAELAGVAGPGWAPDLLLRVRLRGEEREIPVTVGVHEEANRLFVRGSFTVRQTEFGIKPFSVLGGGIRVRDDLRVRLKLNFESVALNDAGTCPGLPVEDSG
jgi:hypothetical protein